MPENGAPLAFTKRSTIRQASNTSGGLEGIPKRMSLVRQSSRSSITSLGNSNSGRNSAIGQFGRKRSVMRKPRTSYWTKLNDEEHQKKLKKIRFIRKIRVAIRLSVFLRSWWYKHLKSVENMILSDEKLDFMTKLIQQPEKKADDGEGLFDLKSFKADRAQKLAHEARRILTILPQYRTEKEVHYVMIAIRYHKQIANYPIRMQRLIAKYGFLECFDMKRAILRQGHPPAAFYYIFYGTVAVAFDDGTSESQILCLLQAGESFGELAIVNDTERQTSVISKTAVELISISKEAYEDVFMAGGAKRMTDPDHEQFIRSLDFLKGWPIHLLDLNPKLFVFAYFQRGSVLVRDSNFSEWIFIVKSGSVNVLKKLVKTESTIDSKTGLKKWTPKPEREKFESFIMGRYEEYCRENGLPIPLPGPAVKTGKGKTSRSSETYPGFPSIPRRRSLSAPQNRNTNPINAVKNANTSPDLTKSQQDKRLLWKKILPPKPKISLGTVIKKYVKITDAGPQEFVPTDQLPKHLKYNEKKSYIDELDKEYKKKAQLLTVADINPEFVKVQTLTKGSTFGLADVILGPQSSFCLTSNSAECLMLNKEFFREHCPEALQRYLLKNVSPYPEEEEMQENLLTKLNWQATRDSTLRMVVEDMQIKRDSIKSARRF